MADTISHSALHRSRWTGEEEENLSPCYGFLIFFLMPLLLPCAKTWQHGHLHRFSLLTSVQISRHATKFKPSTGRIPQTFICTGTYCCVKTGRWWAKYLLEYLLEGAGNVINSLPTRDNREKYCHLDARKRTRRSFTSFSYMYLKTLSAVTSSSTASRTNTKRRK